MQPNSRWTSGGLFHGLGAYALWGVFPLYFHALAPVPPLVILCHRIVWSALLLAAIVTWRGGWGASREIFRSRRALAALSVAAVLIAMNWLIFIYAVTTGQVLQASLGYFINPLFSIALAVIFLRERLRAWQWLAVGVAGAAVANLAWRAGSFPFIALALAGTFGLYGLVRKQVNLGPLLSLLIESILLLPAALLALALLPRPVVGPGIWLLLSLAGVVTAVPLLMFGEAVRQLPLSTLGFLQYVGPTLQFILALAVFKERLDPARLASFALCWAAIGIYAVDSVRAHSPQLLADEPD